VPVHAPVPVDGRAPVDALLAGWHALHVRGALREARAHFDVAHRRAEQAGDGVAMVRAAIGLGGVWVHEHRGAAEAALVRRRQRQGLALAPLGSPEHLELRLRLAAEDDYAASRSDRIMALLPQARRAGDPRVLVSALSLAHHCLLAPDDAATRRALAEEMLEAATASDRPGDLTMAMLWRVVDRFLDGDLHAERALADLDHRLQRHPHLAAEFVVAALQVMLAVRAGRLAEAEGLAAACAVRGEAAGDLDAAGWFAAHLIAVRWYQGRIAEVVPQLDAQVHSPAQSAVDSSAFGALAVAAASTGDQGRAALALSRLGGGDLRALPRSSSWSVSVYGAVEAAVLLGSASTARTAYDLLLPFADRPLMLSLAVTCFGSVEHALGLAALGMDRPDLAVRHLRAAVRADLALGHRPAAVHARHRLGEALARSHDRRERDEGASEHARALAEAAAGGWGLPSPLRGGPPSGTREVVRVQAPADGIVLVRHGGRWTLQWGGRAVEVDHGIGMLYLAVLLARPGQEIPAVDLAAGQSGDREVRADAVQGRTQAVVDDEALRTYRRRLAAIEAELGDAEDRHDAGRVAALTAERDWIGAELDAATGPGRRRRAFAGNAERARIAVGKAVRRALARIAEADPVIGEELRRCIHTGASCCYRPPTSVRLGPRTPGPG